MTCRRRGSRLAQLRSRDRSRERRREHKRDTKQKKRTGFLFAMPYGKHRGLAIGVVPRSYLLWLVREQTSLAARAAREIDRRLGIRLRARGTT